MYQTAATYNGIYKTGSKSGKTKQKESMNFDGQKRVDELMG